MKKLLLPIMLFTGIIAIAQEKPYKMPETGYLLFEAENLDHSEMWEFHEKEAGSRNVCGRGYIKYIGPVTGRGHDQEIDREGTLQGDPKDWLIIPLEITEPGRYRIDLRNHHMHKDGDNDIWVHIIDYPLPIRRVGDHAVDSWQWLTWGPEWVYFDLEKPGVYKFYVAGRSQGFAIDRIAIYHEKATVDMYHMATQSVN
jgi:hypothetical protein